MASPRGTVFRTAVDNQKITRTEVLEGEVTFSNTSGTVDIRQGEGSLARMEEPPASPRMLLPSPAVINYQSTINSLPSRIKFSEVAGAVSFRISIPRYGRKGTHWRTPPFPFRGNSRSPLIEDGNYFLLTQSIDDLGLEGIPSSPQPLHIRVNPYLL